MHSDNTPIGPLRHWSSAVSQAKVLAICSNEPVFVYRRAADDTWFVLTTRCMAGEGQVMETVVHPRSLSQHEAG